MRVIICVDDVNPKSGWNILGTPVEKYMTDLNRKYGAKFTLFIPANYHAKHPLSKNKPWVKELLDTAYFELAAHGYLHQTSDKNKFGECEFFEHRNPAQIKSIVDKIDFEWGTCDHTPIGWRSPGWLCSQESVNELSLHYVYAALHLEHDRNVVWPKHIKKFYGHDGIHITDITVHNSDMIMFQSHIAGDWNDNVWSEINAKQLDISLEYLCATYPDIKFCTLNECI